MLSATRSSSWPVVPAHRLKTVGQERQTEEHTMPMHFIITGNPVDGFQFIGTFADHGDAVDFAEKHCTRDAWWIAELNSIEEWQSQVVAL